LETVISTAKGSYVVYDYLADPPEGGYQEGLVPARINSNSGLWEYYDFDSSLWRNIPSPVSSLRMVVGTAGTSVVDNGLINRIVNAVSVNDTYKVSGFTKLYASNTITFTDSTTVSVNDIIVAIFL
jgi:hypothetical protein